jgi:hypothetical protein
VCVCVCLCLRAFVVVTVIISATRASAVACCTGVAVRVSVCLHYVRALPCVHRTHRQLACRRDLGNNRISGTLPASLSTLTALFSLCAARPRSRHAFCLCVRVCVCVCVSVFACVHCAHRPLARRRDLGNNGLSGTLPASLSTLTALQDLCAPPARPRPRDAFCVYVVPVCVCAGDKVSERCLSSALCLCLRLCVCLCSRLCVCLRFVGVTAIISATRASAVACCTGVAVRVSVCLHYTCVHRLACIACIGSWHVAGTWAITASPGRCPRRSPH